MALINNPGSGGNTNFTDGSIPYASGGILVENNSKIRWDNTNSILYVNGIPWTTSGISSLYSTFTQSGTGAVSETSESALRRVSVQPQHYMTAAQKADVAAYTGAIDVYAAVMAAHDALPSAGGAIDLPPGKYKLSTMPVFSKPIDFRGSGAGIALGKRPTILAPDAGVGGLSLTVDAQFSALRDFYLLSASTIAGTDDGITSKGHGLLVDGVVIDNFGRYGLAMDTSVSGNCNNSVVRRVRSVNNRSHGFYNSGNNVNVCHFDDCDATTNGGWGFYNSGNIQNLHSIPHADGNTLGAFYDNGNSHQYVNPYVEPGTGYNVTFDTGSNSAVWIAGQATAPTITDNGANTQLLRQGGWHKKVTINAAGGPSAANKYSLNSGLYSAGYLALSNDTNSVNIFDVDGSSTRFEMLITLLLAKCIVQKLTVPTYGASVAIDASLGNLFEIRATNGTAFTVANPTNGLTGERITIRIKNTSGGALGAVTWDTLYRLSAWTSPATGTSRSIDFVFDTNAGNWYEVSRTPNDVTN